MIKKCKVCEKEFTTYPSRVKQGRGKYCSKECSMPITNKAFKVNGEETRFKKGQTPHNYKGYTYQQARKGGKKYIEIHLPEHPYANKKGNVRLHRWLVECCLNRFLTKDEVVHHKNGDTLDNSLDNLELMTGAEHRRIHLKDSVHKRWINNKLTLAASWT